ncbi:MAG TPA: hypothetical protein VNT99_09570 [Methylomirabilota bacterium]|nr:hypothetical protein [Methylomirabilota bacterium]
MKTPRLSIIIVSAVAILFLTGCGLSLKQRAAVRDFNRAATGLADITSHEFQHTREDVLKLNIYREQLGDASLDPERMDESFTPERVKIRLDAMTALASYAHLLQKLVDGSQADDLKSAADALVTNLRKAKAFEASDAQGGAIAKAIASVAGLWVEHKRAQAVRQVVRAADPAIKKLLAVVEGEFDLHSSQNWVAGYRAIAITTIGRAIFVEKRHTNALANLLGTTAAAFSTTNAASPVSSNQSEAITNVLAHLARVATESSVTDPRAARAYARSVTNRVDSIARSITLGTQSLGKAQEKLLLTLESREIGAEDVTALAAQVEDFVAIYKTLTAK